eukprot:13610054-Alexandrium_andersonii.AAC.1
MDASDAFDAGMSQAREHKGAESDDDEADACSGDGGTDAECEEGGAEADDEGEENEEMEETGEHAVEAAVDDDA